MKHNSMSLTLKICHQKNSAGKESVETFRVNNIAPKMSFLEMLDILNQQLIQENKAPIEFFFDARKVICGMCKMYLKKDVLSVCMPNEHCLLNMSAFESGDTIVIEPWLSRTNEGFLFKIYKEH